MWWIALNAAGAAGFLFTGWLASRLLWRSDRLLSIITAVTFGHVALRALLEVLAP